MPVWDDARLFEMLTLEGAQAGLSWSMILHWHEGYQRAFAEFDPETVAGFDEARLGALMLDPGIVRNRAKLPATVGNARALLAVPSTWGSFAEYVWSWVNGRPLQPERRTLSDVPATTRLSDRISTDLWQRGFKFVGSTIVYVYLQAVGVVNGHIVSCFRHEQIRALGER